MAEQALAVPLSRLLHLAACQGLAGLADAELLGRFVATREEAAFAALVERHGPLVFATCRRTLTNRQDAEDACQATFLVLARKAASVRKASCLGGWLHGVAVRVAARLKRGADRRGAREKAASATRTTEPSEEATWREVRAALDEELALLPERLRDPLVLRYLECLTRDEVAVRLGLSPGALHGRLERGRALLRERLVRRGLTLSRAFLAAALARDARAALPPLLAVSATRAAPLFAAGESLGEGAVRGKVITLTNEVLGSMSMSKVKLCAALLCVALLASFAGGPFLLLGNAQDARPGTTKATFGLSAREKPESDEDFIRRMSKDLRGTAPTPAEVHFFAASKDPDKREKIIDLFVQERQTRKAEKQTELALTYLAQALAARGATELEGLQLEFYKKLLAARDKDEVAKVTQGCLDRLIEFVKEHPEGKDAAAAIKAIAVLYEAQGKEVEAKAWRERLDNPGKPGKSGKGDKAPRTDAQDYFDPRRP